MVWNVITKDLRVDSMGTFDNSLKKMHRFDRLKKEIQDWQSLLGKLDGSYENADWNHATHRETGVVYDMRVIKRKIAEIDEELKDVENYLDG